MRGSAGLCLLLLLICGLLPSITACSWTISSSRQKRISDCLKRCESQQAQSAQPGGWERQPQWRDSRSACERECHALK
jgi:hypothetical protein